MKNAHRVLAGGVVAALALSVCPRPTAIASDCDDLEDGEPPFAVWIEGFVGASSDGRIRVGKTTLLFDSEAEDDGDEDRGPDVLQSPDQIQRILSRLNVGDGIYAEGTLSPDATVRLTYIERDGGIAPGSEPVSGIVRAVGTSALTVGEDVVSIQGNGNFTTRYDQSSDLSGLRVGDVICVPARRTADGTLVGSDGTFRMSGRGSIVRGTISAVDLTNDPEIQVGGVWCVLDGHESITGLGRDTCAYGGDDLPVAWTVQVRGVLRDGKLIADDVHVLSRAPTKQKRSRLRGWGFVNAAQDERLVVNGLALATPLGNRRRMPTSGALRFAPGQRVRFEARPATNTGSDLVATRIRRR